VRVHSSVTHWLATTASESLTSPPLPFPSLPSRHPPVQHQGGGVSLRTLCSVHWQVGATHWHAAYLLVSPSPIQVVPGHCPRPSPVSPPLSPLPPLPACATRVPHALPLPSLPLPSSLTTTCVRRSPSLSPSQDRASDGASGEHSPAARDPGSVDVSPPCPPPGPQAAKLVRTRAFVRRRHAHKKRQRQRRRQRARWVPVHGQGALAAVCPCGTAARLQ
jgi:hypothetical protein